MPKLAKQWTNIYEPTRRNYLEVTFDCSAFKTLLIKQMNGNETNEELLLLFNEVFRTFCNVICYQI